SYQVIADADIHYNSDIYFISDALTKQPIDGREIVDMQSLALHELGHLLGLAHVDESYDSSSIMNPSLYIGAGLSTRSLSIGDVGRIQKIYNCAGSACDQAATAREIMMASQAAISTAQSNKSH
ncbi:MAG: matrixin family metalloprotease, partial [Proteobacteria bacterium]|nr:matrixin family metalloprotease [Pseudomonadota bacterium]